MATQLQIRRGTTAQMGAFTGAEGELAVNTSTDTVHVHDGATAGGFALAKADGSNIGTYAGSFTTLAASGAVTLSSTLAVTGEITANGGIALGDSDKATFGASDNLQIYHDGNHSYVRDEGAGGLILTTNGPAVYIQKGDTETSAEFNIDGAVKLRYDNSQKFATTSTGIDVTGTATMDGLTVVGADTALAASIGSAGQRVYITPNGTEIIYNASGNSAGQHVWQSGNTERMRILPTGGITFNGDTAQANALDDYEEGAHTTTVSFSGGGSATLINNILAYTKIGNAVIVTGYVAFNGISSPSGILRFTLPFPVDSGIHHRSSADCKFNGLSTGYGLNETPWAIVENNTSTVAVYGGQSTNVNFVMGAACTTTTDFRISVCYITSA